MKYLTFINQFKGFPVITTQNIKNHFGIINFAQISNWQKNGKLIKLKRGLFLLPDITPDPHQLANRLNDSYISLEYALSYYQLIPDIARTITSVSKNRNERIKNEFGNFSYRKINSSLFIGYTLMRNASGGEFYIATPEKSLFDLVYFRNDMKNKNDFDSLRLSKKYKFNLKELSGFAGLVKVKRIKNRLENLIIYLKHG